VVHHARVAWDETLTEQERRRAREQLEQLLERQARMGTADVVTYHPPEAIAQRDLFALAGTHVDGTQWTIGDCDHRFPLQSISKVFTYALALEDNGREATLSRVGVEPSGDPFNSLAFDEVNRRPHNPMVNAGALVAADIVGGADVEERVGRLLERLRIYTGNHDLEVDKELLEAQLADADRNLGISYYMRSLGMLVGEVLDILTVYLSVCSVMVTTTELSVAAATLAHGGVNPLTDERAMPRTYVRDVIGVMFTCGMYDAAGQWANDVGIPAKSGISGGILAAIPQQVGLGVFSPGLDVHGNSVRGVNVCRELSDRFGLHVFADPGETQLGRLGGRVWPEPEPEPEPGALDPEPRDEDGTEDSEDSGGLDGAPRSAVIEAQT
jgi:glutaminase